MTDFDEFSLKIPFFLAILIFMSSLNFIFSCVEHENVLLP